MSIWGNRDYFKDYFWMIEGGLAIYGDCLINNGVLENATFQRAGSAVYDGVTFGPNEPVYSGGKYVHHGEITATVPAYDLSPFVRPTTPDIYETAASAPNPSKSGVNWEATDKRNTWAFNLLAETGTITFDGINITPTKVEFNTVGDLNILSGATGNKIIYIGTDGFVYATDGTNTSKSLQEYVAGNDHTISLALGDSEMQIYLDGVNGSRVPFVGTFNPGTTLKLALLNEDVFSVKNVCGKQTKNFSDAIHLAQFLAHDL